MSYLCRIVTGHICLKTLSDTYTERTKTGSKQAKDKTPVDLTRVKISTTARFTSLHFRKVKKDLFNPNGLLASLPIFHCQCQVQASFLAIGGHAHEDRAYTTSNPLSLSHTSNHAPFTSLLLSQHCPVLPESLQLVQSKLGHMVGIQFMWMPPCKRIAIVSRSD